MKDGTRENFSVKAIVLIQDDWSYLNAMREVLSLIIFCCTTLAAEYPTPERRVHANVVASDRDPKIEIKLPSSVQYVGADRWPLFDIADCELHVFVEANPQRHINRLYWIQFEAYLPSQPELHHTYPFSHTETLNGVIFDVRARFGSSADVPKPGSDLEHVQALLHTKRLQMPEGMMNVRFVHLLDPEKRKELMIIYAEDLNAEGFALSDILPGGRRTAEWPHLEASLIQRAKEAITLSPR